MNGPQGDAPAEILRLGWQGLRRAGAESTGRANARSWLGWGRGTYEPKVGDVVVLWRKSPESAAGHVGFFVRKEGSQLWLLGGNQRNSVSIQPYDEDRLLGYRTAA